MSELIGQAMLGHLSEYKIGKVFAASNFFVHEITDTDMIVKVYNMSEIKWLTKEQIEQEIRFNQRATALGVTPPFVDSEFSTRRGQKYALLVFIKYGQGNLTQLVETEYYRENTEAIHKQLRTILDTLYDSGIDHNDLHSNNFLYQMLPDGDIEIKIIDYDCACELGDGERRYKIEIVGTSDIIDLTD